jgi:hypothetical protein
MAFWRGLLLGYHIISVTSYKIFIARNNFQFSRLKFAAFNNDLLVQECEAELGSLTRSIKKRGVADDSMVISRIQEIATNLESLAQSVTDQSLLDGCWRLVFTSTPGTNSPIQRTFTAIDSVEIFQVINLVNKNESFLSTRNGNVTESLPDVSNTVCFFSGTDRKPFARLRVTALASTFNYPLLEPRKGDGKIFGLNIFGISSSAAPRRVEERIDFAFQEAMFEFRDLPLQIPYPVPFRLLGDEAKGWIDNTFVSKKYRVARGNKGTLFLLERVDSVSDDPAAAFAAQKLQKPKVIGITRRLPLPQRRIVKRAAIIFPAQLATQEDYAEMATEMERQAAARGRPLKVYVAPLRRTDWPVGLLPSFFSSAYWQGKLEPASTMGFYLRKVDEALSLALEDLRASHVGEDKELQLSLVGHSIGGWLARAWLSEWSQREDLGGGLAALRTGGSDGVRVKPVSFLSLGSPHAPPPATSSLAAFDQTRGLLSSINSRFPGAKEEGVTYHSAIGSSVEGRISPSVGDLESLLAYVSYLFLCGDGKVRGDGIIPVETARLMGRGEGDSDLNAVKDGELLILDGEVRHSNFVPAPGKSFKLPVTWYGSEEVVSQWIDLVV